jgi:hypothetical protein
LTSLGQNFLVGLPAQGQFLGRAEFQALLPVARAFMASSTDRHASAYHDQNGNYKKSWTVKTDGSPASGKIRKQFFTRLPAHYNLLDWESQCDVSHHQLTSAANAVISPALGAYCKSKMAQKDFGLCRYKTLPQSVSSASMDSKSSAGTAVLP